MNGEETEANHCERRQAIDTGLGILPSISPDQYSLHQSHGLDVCLEGCYLIKQECFMIIIDVELLFLFNLNSTTTCD
ncbi:hypothetical protein K1719_047305 [Acacia pycnantha]|nr:hypothetical protein K1719_047305 [Acacia pycnantha]